MVTNGASSDSGERHTVKDAPRCSASAVQSLKECARLVKAYPSTLIWPLLILGAMLGLGLWGVLRMVRLEERSAQERAANLAWDTAVWFRTQIIISATPVQLIAAMMPHHPHREAASATFSQLAPALMSQMPYNATRSMQLLPNGVITDIYPLAGNEKRPGINIFAATTPDTASREAAIKAVKDKVTTLYGPMDSSQGGPRLIIRAPVFVPVENANTTFGYAPNSAMAAACGAPCQYNATTNTTFWGFVTSSVTLNTIIEAPDSHVRTLEALGYNYQVQALSSVDPSLSIIAASRAAPRNPVEANVELPNTMWVVRVAPQSGWKPSYYAGLLAAVVIVAVAAAVLLFATLLSRRRHQLLLEALLPKKVIRELHHASLSNAARREPDAPADLLLGMMAQLVEGQMPDLRDVLLVRSALLRNLDVYQPFNLQGHIKEANLDTDVTRALVRELVGDPLATQQQYNLLDQELCSILGSVTGSRYGEPTPDGNMDTTLGAVEFVLDQFELPVTTMTLTGLFNNSLQPMISSVQQHPQPYNLRSLTAITGAAGTASLLHTLSGDVRRSQASEVPQPQSPLLPHVPSSKMLPQSCLAAQAQPQTPQPPQQSQCGLQGPTSQGRPSSGQQPLPSQQLQQPAGQSEPAPTAISKASQRSHLLLQSSWTNTGSSPPGPGSSPPVAGASGASLSAGRPARRQDLHRCFGVSAFPGFFSGVQAHEFPGRGTPRTASSLNTAVLTADGSVVLDDLDGGDDLGLLPPSNIDDQLERSLTVGVGGEAPRATRHDELPVLQWPDPQARGGGGEQSHPPDSGGRVMAMLVRAHTTRSTFCSGENMAALVGPRECSFNDGGGRLRRNMSYVSDISRRLTMLALGGHSAAANQQAASPVGTAATPTRVAGKLSALLARRRVSTDMGAGELGPRRLSRLGSRLLPILSGLGSYVGSAGGPATAPEGYGSEQPPLQSLQEPRPSTKQQQLAQAQPQHCVESPLPRPRSLPQQQSSTAPGASSAASLQSTMGLRARVHMPKVEKLLAHVDSWQYDMWALQRETEGHALSVLGFFLMQRSGLIRQFRLSRVKVARFLRFIEAGYLDNPYHNATHAADVLQTLHVIIHATQLNVHYLDHLGLLGAYLAAVVHDFGHPGLTGDFLVATSDPLAVLYNDRSPLENHHCAASFGLMRQRPDLDFLAPLSKQDKSTLRKQVIDLVLATDMKQHFSIVSHFNTVHRLNAGTAASGGQVNPRVPTIGRKEANAHAEIVERISAGAERNRASAGAALTACETQANGALPSAPQPLDDSERLLSLQVALKCADVGHLGEDLEVHKRWLMKLEEEFFRQGDRERELEMPISPLFDRSKQGVSKSQVGFFDFVALPLVQALSSAFPGAKPLLDCFSSNYAHWKAVAAAAGATSGSPLSGPLGKCAAVAPTDIPRVSGERASPDR